MTTDFVDITPHVIDPTPGSNSKGQGTVFQEQEWRQIKENPNNLTKEGLDEKVRIWKRSQNKHVQIKYQTMKAQCQKLAESGKTKDGRTIFSRFPDGAARWLSPEIEKEKKIK
ncbi:hypothetical protein CMI37_31050 [Candidatus Pacearchaeota archaeon]|jgi:hypothetical protein|nr:hypothetical protein [Candidatus Pacearchaeota archaeon]|tara:strand:+ start:7977 stop:8315 length:339 start_codon:yes stop_codon:yes gene_type:complete